MLFFRSDEALDEWCKARQHPRRPIATLPQLWRMAVAWYANRLSAQARGRMRTRSGRSSRGSACRTHSGIPEPTGSERYLVALWIRSLHAGRSPCRL